MSDLIRENPSDGPRPQYEYGSGWARLAGVRGFRVSGINATPQLGRYVCVRRGIVTTTDGVGWKSLATMSSFCMVK
jgi:hypothetical protein